MVLSAALTRPRLLDGGLRACMLEGESPKLIMLVREAGEAL